MKLEEQIDLLNKQVQNATNMLINAENAINMALENIMHGASSTEMKQIQNQIVQIKELVHKAKKGENVDGQIEIIAKNIKDGSQGS